MLFIACICGCKKENSANFGLKGHVTDGDTGEPVPNTRVKVEKQVVASGVFGEAYQFAMSTTTDASGNFTGTWPRENFAALRMLAEKENYINTSRNLDVDAFKREDFEFITADVRLFKEAFIQVNLTNSGTALSNDQLSFTFLNANFDCNCCSNGWRLFEGAAVDTSWTCRIYGNHWIKYQVQIATAQQDSIYVDSVFCPANETSVLGIGY